MRPSPPPPVTMLCLQVIDAMIGDPPYGVRAGGKKSVPKDHVIHYPTTHIPSTDPYGLGECMRDLLDMAARLLRRGGRLVFFLPSTRETFQEEELPEHPMMALVSDRCAGRGGGGGGEGGGRAAAGACSVLACWPPDLTTFTCCCCSCCCCPPHLACCFCYPHRTYTCCCCFC